MKIEKLSSATGISAYGGKNKKGFSLIEVIAAVFILSIGIVSTVGLMSKNIGNSINSRNTIIASELAQEGIELARNVRDNNFASGSNAFANFDHSANSNNCIIDKDNSLFTCNNGNLSKVLHFNENNGFYIHKIVPNNFVNNPTKYQRKIMLSYPNANQANVKSMVIWGSGFPSDSPGCGASCCSNSCCSACSVGNKCVCVEDILTDWK